MERNASSTDNQAAKQLNSFPRHNAARIDVHVKLRYTNSYSQAVLYNLCREVEC